MKLKKKKNQICMSAQSVLLESTMRILTPLWAHSQLKKDLYIQRNIVGNKSSQFFHYQPIKFRSNGTTLLVINSSPINIFYILWFCIIKLTYWYYNMFVHNEIVLEDIIKQKSYLNSASSSTTPSEEDVIKIAKIENLLPRVNYFYRYLFHMF